MLTYYIIQAQFKFNTVESVETGIIICILLIGNLRLSNIMQLSLKNP